MNIIFDYNRTLYDPECGALYPGVFETLSILAKEHTLFLVSRNEPGRRRDMETLNIAHFFCKVAFVEEKTTDIFSELLSGTNQGLIVGDMLSDEIRIGNLLGVPTVWVRQGLFAVQTPSNTAGIPSVTIASIPELLKIDIHLYEQ